MLKSKRLIPLFLVFVMLAACFAGCAGNGGADETTSPAAQTTAATPTGNAQISEDVPGDGGTGLPIVEETVTISIWAMWMTEILPGFVSDVNDLPAFDELESRTNVALEYIQTPPMNGAQNFAIMAGADAWTDIVWNFKDYYTGGLVGGYEDGVIYQLDEYIDAYMPNYRAIRDSDDNRRAMSYTDDGWTGAIIGYIINGAITYGFVTRQDWLDDLGMDAPVTYDDWFDVLSAYKVSYGISDPLLMSKYIDWAGNSLSSGYNVAAHSLQRGINKAFYQVDGEVRYGPVQDEYRAFISMLHDWYAAGLISSDFSLREGNTNLGVDEEVSLIVNGETGIWLLNAMWFDTNVEYGKAVNDAYDLVALPFPLINEGDVSHTLGQLMVPNYFFSITTAADTETVEIICKWFDYIFSDEGYLLGMYGLEDWSWEYGDDGKPHYTDYVYSNPEFSFDQMRNYVSLGIIGLRLGDSAVSREYYGERSLEAWEYWYYMKDDKYAFPSTTTPTSAETEALNNTMADITTYVEENVPKFITGEKNMSEWDAFVAGIENMDIGGATAIMQEIMNRYLSR